MSSNRRARILAHAEAHFAEHGYQGASLSAIARASGLGNPGLLHHFPSKAKLYRAVLESLAEEITARLRRALATASTPTQRLRVLVRDHMAWMAEHPQGIRVIQRELLDNAERVSGAHVLPMQPYLLLAQGLIEGAQGAGVARDDLPAKALLCLILGTLSYAVVVRPTLRQALDDATLADGEAWRATVCETVLRLIETQAS